MKKNIQALFDTPADQASAARILSRDGDEFELEQDSRILKARKAFSCLVTPLPGDKVLLSRCEGQVYVLAILERLSSASQIDFPGDVSINTPKGRLSIDAGDELQIQAGSIRQESENYALKSAKTQVFSDETMLHGRAADVHLGRLNVLTDNLTRISKMVIDRISNSVRLITGSETVEADSVVQRVKTSYALHSGHAVIDARKDIKIDGERIHMG